MTAATSSQPIVIGSKGFIKPQVKADKDWTYLASKTPASNHVLYATMVTELSGVEISPEQVMALLAMHRWMQASDQNQAREDFRGRTWASVAKGSETLGQRAAVVVAEKGEEAKVVAAPRANVEITEGEDAEIVEEPETLALEAASEPTKLTKAELVAAVVAYGKGAWTEAEAKKLTVKKLEAVLAS